MIKKNVKVNMIPFTVSISERDCIRLEKVAQNSGTTIEECIQTAVHNQMAKVQTEGR